MFLPAVIRSQNAVYRCENGKINLKSTAALEVIEARSGKLRGVIDPAAQSFAWTIEVRYFEGFNSPLQQEHFNENYLESTVYPKATFTGRIIEQVNFQQQG
ncbi:MAG: YceI family protein, partial [Bacteroidota bacterium]